MARPYSERSAKERSKPSVNDSRIMNVRRRDSVGIIRQPADLDTDRIAAAGLAVAQAKGLEGFTMRAVAEALGVTPMALYHHVKDKAALAALIIDKGIRDNPLPAATGRWQDDLCGMALWSRRGMAKNPIVIHLRRAYHVWTPSMLRISQQWLELWRQSGLQDRHALQAATLSGMTMTGLIMEEAIFQKLKWPSDETLGAMPEIRRMFAADHDREAEFELVVRALIEGLFQRLSIAQI
jgi:AcrR family transcriptional regulator